MRGIFNRRRFLQGAASLTALGAGSLSGVAAQSPASAMRPLPARGSYLIRNAYVMTMDPALGDIAGGDVHVANGAIVAVGKNLRVSGATNIDGGGMIAMPGMVETHWHMWNSLMRSMAGDKPELGYFRTTATLGKVYRAEDMYQGTRLAAAEAINNGITFVHDWCHNIRSPDYARQDLRALQETGLRARFSYGVMQGQAVTELPNLADIEQLHRDWAGQSTGGLIALGFAWRGSGGNSATVPPEIYKTEFETASKLGLPMSVHASGSKPASGQVAAIAKAGLLAKGMQIIHANYANPEELQAMAAAGAVVSSSPYSELRIGFGMLQTANFLAAGIPVGLSVDTIELSGNADMFAIMKATQNIENGRAESEFKLLPRRVIELATIEGAKSMGMEDQIGSLKPGKRADLILVSTSDVNMGVFTDPAHMIVEAAQPSNVDMVMVDGRILKRRGKLTAMDVKQVVREASAALTDIRKRANWW